MEAVIDGVLLRYQVVNPQAKKKCLILHGWGHKSDYWLELTRFLDSSFCYVIPDLPGFGGSTIISGNPGVPEYSELVRNFIRALKINKLVIIGHSFGGQIAVDLAVNRFKKASRYIFVSPAIIRKRGFSQKMKIFLYHKFSFLKRILPSPVIKFLLKKFSSTDYYRASKTHKNILNKIVVQDYSRRLKEINKPVDIIWGDRDKEIPNEGKSLAETINKGYLHVLYGIGHNPHLESPIDFAEVINNILKKCQTSR